MRSKEGGKKGLVPRFIVTHPPWATLPYSKRFGLWNMAVIRLGWLEKPLDCMS